MIRNFTLAYIPSWYNALGEWLDDPKSIYRNVYARSKSVCQLCGNKAGSIYPIAHLDYERQEIVFTRFIAVCPECNEHLKLSALHEDEAEVTRYLERLLNKTTDEIEKMISVAHHNYVVSKNWKMDMSIIADSMDREYKKTLRPVNKRF